MSIDYPSNTEERWRHLGVSEHNLLAIDLTAFEGGPDAADNEVTPSGAVLLPLLLRLALADGFLRSQHGRAA